MSTRIHDQVAASRAGNRHVELEFLNDVEKIMESVGRNHIMFSQRQEAPDGGWSYTFQDTYDDVHAFYGRRNEDIEVLTSRHFLEISTSWHTFLEGVSETRLKATGERVKATFIALLVPEDVEGNVVGECPWSRIDDRRRDPAAGTDGLGVAVGRLDLLDLHEGLVDALQRGDAAALAAPFHDEAGFMVGGRPFGVPAPVAAHGRDEIQAWYAAFLERNHIVEVQCTNRACGEWYVYADEYWRVEGADAGEYRVVEYLPIDAGGRVLSRVSYGVPAE